MLLPLLLTARPAAAEGFLANGAVLYQETELRLDVFADDEVIYWYGDSDIELYGPDKSLQGTYGSGALIPAEGGPGTYTARMLGDQTSWWQLGVEVEGTAVTGRLHSKNWRFDTTGTESGQWMYFYVLVPQGDGTEGLIKAELHGITGSDLQIVANAVGVGGHGRSIPLADGTPAADYPIYLDYPARSLWPSAVVSSVPPAFEADGLCDGALAEGVSKGHFVLDAPLDGVALITCDTDGDSTFDRSGHTDLVLLEEVAAGTASVGWGGLDADEAPLSAGTYTCQVEFLQGSLHVLVANASTAYQGVRLLSESSDDNFGPDRLFWSDVLIQDSNDQLPYSLGTPRISAGADGVFSGTSSAPTANTNTHAWGDYSETSKGTGAWVDTWTAANRVTLGTVTVEVLDSALDADGDSLLDAQERCLVGTDPEDPDTDGDGLGDAEEVADVSAPRDTDGDDLIDALDDDDDGDGILTGTERAHAETWGDDVDSDDLANWHDTDSDSDDIPDEDEPDDGDDDGVPDYLQAAVVDTGAPPDSGTPPLDTAPPGGGDDRSRGTFSGGAFACGSAAPAPSPALPALLVLMSGLLWRRRRG